MTGFEPLDPYLFLFDVIGVKDGDTLVGDIHQGFYDVKKSQTIRIREIDCPEKGQKGFYQAKEFAVQNVLNKRVLIRSISPKPDSFGRWLVDLLYLEGDAVINYATRLLELELAEPYRRG